MKRNYEFDGDVRVPIVDCEPEELRAIVLAIQKLLWFDETSQEWDPGKEIDSDTLGWICELMGDRGLATDDGE